MKNKLFKVKRRFVDWYKILSELGDLKHSEDFWSLKNKHPRMSNNRVAYNVLKRYYSTTALTFVRFNGGNYAALSEYRNHCLGNRGRLVAVEEVCTDVVL